MEGVIVTSNNSARLKTRTMRNNLARNTKNHRQSLTRNHSLNNYKINNRNNNNNNNNNSNLRSNSLTNIKNQRQNQINNFNNINKKLNNCQNLNNATTQSTTLYANNNNNNNNNNGINNNISSSDSATTKVCAGKFTSEVYDAIRPRLGHTLHIPEDSIQAFFNDMQLNPSETQVKKMLQCARQCGRRNGAPFLTFGEFCVFVREMQKQSPTQQRKNQLSKTNNKCGNNCEVFLGGSCNPTTWRADTAIPELEKHGISFYNPQVSMWAPELVAQEHDAKQSASVLLFVVDSQTRSTGGMIEVAYLVASGRCVVLVAHPYRPGQSIMGETVTQKEYKDLVEGQASLLMLVKSRGVKVHTNLSAALQCTANILRNSSTNNGMTSEEQVIFKLRKLREVFDSYGGQNGEISFYNILDAYEKLTQRTLKINELYTYLNSTNENVTNMSITFERFCMLMAEFTTDHCDNMCTTDGRFSNPLYWTCAFLKTRHLLKSYIVQPITNALVWATQPFQRQCSTNNNSCNINNIDCIMNEDEINNTSHHHHHLNNKIQLKNYDVFLGGTNTSHINWRRDIAIPLLKKHGITYYNPVIRNNINNDYELLDNLNDNYLTNNKNNITKTTTTDDDVFEFKEIMNRSKILLFIITNDTRSLTTMILAAHYIGLNRNVVLCIQHLPNENCLVADEILSKQAIKDYNRGRVYLGDLAKRKQVPVFDNITEAVQCTVDKYQNR